MLEDNIFFFEKRKFANCLIYISPWTDKQLSEYSQYYSAAVFVLTSWKLQCYINLHSRDKSICKIIPQFSQHVLLKNISPAAAQKEAIRPTTQQSFACHIQIIILLALQRPLCASRPKHTMSKVPFLSKNLIRPFLRFSKPEIPF